MTKIYGVETLINRMQVALEDKLRKEMLGLQSVVVSGKEVKPKAYGGSAISSQGNTSKFKSAFGEPPAVPKKKVSDPTKRRKQPNSFFGTFRPRDLQQAESGQVSPPNEVDLGIQNI